jgi:hypothetical protein
MSFVVVCLLWIRTNATCQKGHSLLPVAVELGPVDCCIELAVHLPAIAPAAGAKGGTSGGSACGAPVVAGTPAAGERALRAKG